MPWLGQPGRQELAFNHIFDPPMVRHCRAPRPALDPRCECSHRVVAFRAARPSSSCEVAGWLCFELPGLGVVGPSDRHLGWSGQCFGMRSEGTQPPSTLELSARPALSHPR